jgi:DnaJ domain
VASAAKDPYATLGISSSATDAELRGAYRRLVQLHHPDHNRGSAESARRFEEIQEAYARVRELRAGGAKGVPRATQNTAPPRTAHTSASVEDRLRVMEEELRVAREARERELREARAARERAAQAAREAAAAAAGSDPDRSNPAGTRTRATDEELGYYETDDSFAKILADVRADVTELFGRAMSAAEHAAEEAAKRAADRRADRRD